MSLVLSSFRDTFYAVTSCCFPNPTLHINRRTFKVIKLLGEGGFSFVYLVQDASTGRQYALKKIRCPFGSDSVKNAMKEADMYKLFSHENIIKVIDTCIIQDKDGGKIVYIFLPYYKNGNLQDVIDNNLVQDKHFSEREMLKIFRGICYAVRTLHTYRFPSVPLRSETNVMENEINNGSITSQSNEPNEDDIVPFAHRDIKPGNVLLSDDMQTPVLMDFGSLIRARIKIQTRNQALLQQDLAAEHSTMPYRAPELFDVKTNVALDEKVDIWSLGCTLYAMAYGKSPFENSMNEQGGSIALAVLNAQVRFPSVEQDKYSPEFRDLISDMLIVDPKDRPNIHHVISKVDAQLEQLGS
ncbi:12519_t:CDS:2 [Funneliformis caledonium]|uniref:non-specific serine/threonine protein kinase n=2 Tax=Funneliformis TaxID=1117308 RepID=A0A9N9G5K8_9GLOM|nr:12519_t:CDS:2 [Funneliformis caledonium]CAG8694585.1 8457_t:CDS:2 [Funneliformis mosseae]